jgi:GTPase-associated protein 1, N-terminal domain type 2
MRLEQAIFTSVRSERLDGYQLAARSGGVSDELAKELTGWGPAHDSLWLGHPGASSVNFHALAEDRFCVSQTTLSGAEYSGRGGGRVYTQMIVIPKDGLVKFGGDPFLVLRALVASGRMMVYDTVPRELTPIPLIGRSSEGPPTWVQEVVEKVGAETIAELSAAARGQEPVTVITDLPVERLFQTMLYQLEPAERLEVSFTTGLKPSSRRAFKLTIAPDDPSLVRQSQRMHHGKVIEALTSDPHGTKRQKLTVARAR